MSLNNEEVLKLFSRNAQGDLLFDGRLLIKWDTVAPERIPSASITEISTTNIKVEFELSPSDDVAYYQLDLTTPAYSREIRTLKVNNTSVEFTDLNLNEMTDYEIWIYAVDASENKSQSFMLEFSTFLNNVEQPPILDRASISLYDRGDNLPRFNFKNFYLAEEIDIYLNEVYQITIPATDYTFDFVGEEGSVEHNWTSTRLKAIARNQYGEAEKTIYVYY